VKLHFTVPIFTRPRGSAADLAFVEYGGGAADNFKGSGRKSIACPQIDGHSPSQTPLYSLAKANGNLKDEKSSFLRLLFC
jgi:hypothetical protein